MEFFFFYCYCSALHLLIYANSFYDPESAYGLWSIFSFYYPAREGNPAWQIETYKHAALFFISHGDFFRSRNFYCLIYVDITGLILFGRRLYRGY